MFTEAQHDMAAINAARSRYNARMTESSLIAWICSEAWAVHPDHFPHGTYRGLAHKRATAELPEHYNEANTISGEIGGAS